jgi:DNA polymerase-3 subunit gamma/tau
VSAGPSLYRRHRPRTFADVVGQEHVVRTLSHAVERGAVHHAYLFVGSRGTGKTSMAKILAACLNCDSGAGQPTITPCGVCESCVSIANATSLDVIEMDAASNNSVDDIRELRDSVAYAPVSGRHKVYILDEAHMLSPQAWNAFLKTLEEPPPRTVFVLATTEAQKVLPTVVDRCHRFDFGRPSAEQIASVLRRVASLESIDLDEGAGALIARHATGSFRDALGTLEQLLAYAGERRIEAGDVLTVLGVADADALFAAVQAIADRAPRDALRAAAALAASGRDPTQMLRDLEVHGRELLSVQMLGEVPPELRVTPDRDARLLAQARALSEADSVRLLSLVSDALQASANGAQASIQLELALIKGASPELDPSREALLARIERLERGLAEAGAERSPITERAAAAPEPAPPASEPAAPAAEPAAPAAEPAPVSAGAEAAPGLPPVLDLDGAVAVWPAVVDLVRGRNAMLAALLQGARPLAVSDGELTVAFPQQAAFLKRKAEQEEHRRTAGEALRNLTGVSLRLRYELADAEPEAGVGSPGTEALDEEALVRRFVEQLDAEEIAEPEQKAD